MDIAVNTEIDSEKRIETLEKANNALEHTNFELQATVVQLEADLKASKEQFTKQQQQHDDQVQQIQSHAQQQIAAAKALNSGIGGPIDWTKCEELVEKLLLTGDLPREQLENDDLDEDGEDDERVYARKLHQEAAQELKKLGLEYAIGCLAVMKENLFFASNTAVELQDMMSKQSLTVEFLEKRLHEQKREAEQMKLQIQHLTEESQSHAAASGGGGPATVIPRSKSYSGAVSKRNHRAPSRQSSSRDNSSSIQDFGGMGDDSDSDSDKDSETSTHSCSQYNQRQQQAISQGSRSTKSPSSQASSQSGQSTMALLIAPLGSGENGGSTRSLKTGGDKDASVAESHHRSNHDESSRHDSSSFKDNAIRSGTLPDNTSDSFGTAAGGNPPLKSGSDMIRKRMELLKNGSLFVKYGRFGKPHVRFVWCSPDLEYLNYRTISKQAPKASIPTRSIHKIHLGQATKVFERAKQTAREPFCFSVEYEDNRTLDLEVRLLVHLAFMWVSVYLWRTLCQL